MNKINVFEMEENQISTGLICVQTASVEFKKNKQRYVRGTGVFDGDTYNYVCWEESLVDTLVGQDRVFNVLISCSLYNGEKQYTIKELYEVCTDVDVAEFFTKIDTEAIREQFERFIKENFSKGYQELIHTLIPDDIMNLFCVTPAAIHYHDNFCGGLMFHTYKVMQILKSMCDIYGLRDKKEFMLFCGLVHDIGKIVAMDYRLMEYTIKGTKLTHEALGIIYMTQKAKVLKNYLTKFEIDTMLGVIENHRGVDYGARPGTVEAYLVHYADNMEAQTTSVLAFIENQQKTALQDKVVRYNGNYMVIEGSNQE